MPVMYGNITFQSTLPTMCCQATTPPKEAESPVIPGMSIEAIEAGLQSRT
jgi:hypothetical protein